MKKDEHKLQVACVKWFRYQYPNLYYNLFAIPNGGYRPDKTGVFLKAEGVVAGVSDIFLAIPRGGYHGAFIEMKILPKKPSKKQFEFAEKMKIYNYDWIVCYNFDQFKDFIEMYLSL